MQSTPTTATPDEPVPETAPYTGWKVFTHDYRPPIQGGPPVYDGAYPVTLPPVALDSGPDDCGRGYNYCADLATAFRIGGLWPDGRPSRAVRVSASADAVIRGDKRRASQLTLLGEATAAEVHAAITALSAPFGEHGTQMAAEQAAWREALARPASDPEAVTAGLTKALRTRGLDWQLRRFASARIAEGAWTDWDAWETRNARDASKAWAARDAWNARDAWDTRAVWQAKGAWTGCDIRDARAAWNARDALTVSYAALCGWVDARPDALTTGLRDAYRNGLAIAFPTGPNELGYALDHGAGHRQH